MRGEPEIYAHLDVIGQLAVRTQKDHLLFPNASNLAELPLTAQLFTQIIDSLDHFRHLTAVAALRAATARKRTGDAAHQATFQQLSSVDHGRLHAITRRARSFSSSSPDAPPSSRTAPGPCASGCAR